MNDLEINTRNIESYNQQIDSLNKEIEFLKKDFINVKEDKAKLEKELKTIQSSHKSHEEPKEFLALKQKNDELLEKEAYYNDLIKSLKDQIMDIAKNLDTQINKIQTLDTKNKELTIDLEQLVKEKSDLLAKNINYENAVQSLSIKNEEIQSVNSRLERELHIAHSDNKNITLQIKEKEDLMNKEINAKNDEIQSLNKKLKTLDEELLIRFEEIRSLSEDFGKLKISHQNMMERYEAIKTEKEELLQKFTNFESFLKQQKSEMENESKFKEGLKKEIEDLKESLSLKSKENTELKLINDDLLNKLSQQVFLYKF